jgi:hypothetical protein
LTPPLARRKASGEPNFVACGSAIDPLQNELEVERQLELADHDDGRIIAPQRQQVAASDLTFDNEAESLEEGLDRAIEQRLQNRFQARPSSKQLRASTFTISEAPDRQVFRVVATEVMLGTPTFRSAGIASFGASRTGGRGAHLGGFREATILDRGDTFSTLSTGRTRP